MMCAKVKSMVDGLEQQYGDAVDFEVLDWKEPDSVLAADELGFEDGHGMVMTGGAGDVAWKEASHFQWKKPDEVEAEVKKLKE